VPLTADERYARADIRLERELIEPAARGAAPVRPEG
jgi:hypothetical protein